eukprot:m.9262 g.9262  ORF g.9262 m.9262 type:complete len:134 (-) comp5375_c0_seq1:91-492(-)
MARIVHTGRLTKQGAIFKTWRSRFFELTEDKKLRYYRMESEGERTLRGEIDLVDCVTLLMRDETKVTWPEAAVFCFALVTDARTFFLVADSVEAGWRWVGMIKKYSPALSKAPMPSGAPVDDYDRMRISLATS